MLLKNLNSHGRDCRLNVSSLPFSTLFVALCFQHVLLAKNIFCLQSSLR